MIESDGTGLIGSIRQQCLAKQQPGENNLGIFDYFCFGGGGLVNPINAG